jgi:YbbR domain-containing protein
MKDLLLHNWHLKLISLLLATILWAEVARIPTSEIALSVPLEIQNIPKGTEVYGDTTDPVEVRLRGPSSLVRTVTPQALSIAIDLNDITMGQGKILPLSPELVRAPAGVEVVQVIPARVRMTIEPKATKTVRIYPRLTGSPAAGFELGKAVVTPESIEIEGPASHVMKIESIETTDINVSGKQATFRENPELDIEDPLIRVPKLDPIAYPIVVEVRIGRK